jgi:LacI family transcriptional regulator
MTLTISGHFRRKEFRLYSSIEWSKPIIIQSSIIDNYKCGYQATRHLIDQGCKKIAHVTSSLKRNVYSERYRGYRDALFDNNIPLDETLLIINDLSEKAGIEAAKQILSMHPLPDGAFITNDFVAAVCMRTLKEHNYKNTQ